MSTLDRPAPFVPVNWIGSCQPLDLGKLPEQLTDDRERPRHEKVIRTKPAHHLPRGVSKSLVDCLPGAAVRFRNPPGKLTGALFDQVDRTISRAAVYDYVLEPWVFLAEHGVHRRGEVLPAAKRGRDDGDRRKNDVWQEVRCEVSVSARLHAPDFMATVPTVVPAKVTRVVVRVHDRLASRLPPAMGGRVDLLRPSHRHGAWNGPLNGQERRREIVQQLASVIGFHHVIETGTHRGATTAFFTTLFDAAVDTVESDLRLAAYASGRFRWNARVTVHRADSRTFLRALPSRLTAADEPLFVYLDAHWHADLPLWEELQILAGAQRDTVIMIDDFQVPSDDGYGFDDYGPGQALTEACLPVSHLSGWSLMYPSARAEDETGWRRGSCVIASPRLARQAAVAGLTPPRMLLVSPTLLPRTLEATCRLNSGSATGASSP